MIKLQARDILLFAAACVLVGYFLYVAHETVSSVAAFVFLCPPVLLIGSITGTLKVMKIKIYLFMVAMLVGFSAAFLLHFAHAAGYLEGDAALAWLETARTTSQLFFLPFYFAALSRGDRRGTPRAAGASRVITLPGGIIAGLALVHGSPADTVFRSKGCRAVAHTYCSFIVHCACTLATAAAAAALGLIAVETILTYVTVCSAVSLALCHPLILFKKLRTSKYLERLSWAMVPALAATFLLQTYGGVELKEIGSYAALARNVLWIAVLPFTGYTNAMRAIQQ